MPCKVEKLQIGNRLISKDNYYKHQKFNPQTGCTEWTGVKSNIGYGFIGFTYVNDPTKRAGMMTVHRIALTLKLGRAIAPGMNANHSCHNKLCVSESHLSEGTQTQKRKDMIQDGIGIYQGGQRGEYGKQHNRKYKFTPDEIQWIRNAEIEDIVQKHKLTKSRAANLRLHCRNGYKWLPWDKK